MSQSSTQLTVNLQSLDGQPPAAFTFAGTGTSSAQDAVASSYSVNLALAPGAATLQMFTVGTPLRFYGFVAPFGAAPPDFLATTLVGYAASDATLRVQWPQPGVTAPFALPVSGATLVLTQAMLQAAVQHSVQIGPQRLDPSTLSAGVTLSADAAATSPQFAVGHVVSRTVDSYSTFPAMVTALGTDLNGTTAMLGLAGQGPYNATTGALSVDKLVILLND